MSNEIIVLSLNSSNCVVQDNNKMTYNIPTNFEADSYEVAIGNAFIFNSNYNINATLFQNSTLKYIWPTGSTTTTYDVTVPDGYYSVSDFDAFLQTVYIQNKTYLIDSSLNNVFFTQLVENRVYYRVSLIQTPVPSALSGAYAGYTQPVGAPALPSVDNVPQMIILPLTTSKVGPLLGFNPATYPPAQQSSLYSTNGQISPTLSPQYVFNINLQCVNNSFISTTRNSIYQFSFTTEFGLPQIIEPAIPFFYPIANNSYHQLILWISDQEGRYALLQDPSIQVTLLLRKKNYSKIKSII